MGLLIGFNLISPSRDSTNESNSYNKKTRNNKQFIFGGILGWLIGSLFTFPFGGLVLGMIVGLKIKQNEIEIIEAFEFSLNNKRRKSVYREIINGLEWAFNRLLIF